VAAKAQLICAALALFGVGAAPAAAGDAARSAGRVDSLSAALEASDTALFGRVTAVDGNGSEQRGEIRVLETLRGPELPKRITVIARAEALLEGDVRLRADDTLLLLVKRSRDRFEVPAGLRRAVVPVATDAERDQTRALLRGYAAGGAALDAVLRKSATLAHPQLRAGVLEDLSHRLTDADSPFLLRLATQRDVPLDARRFAIAGLAGLPGPIPPALADLLRPDEPVAIRQAVVNAHAAHDVRDVVERGLADPDEAVRRTAIDNLAGPRSVAVLERHFDREPAQAVKLAIVQQLGLVGTDASHAALRRLVARTSDPAIRRAAEPWLGAKETTP
jgi:hypothetical protein